MKLTHDESLEVEVIGSLMLSSAAGSGAWADVADVLAAEHFASPTNRTAFAGIGRLAAAGKPYDANSLAAALREAGQIEAAGGTVGLIEIQANTSGFSTVRHYATLLRGYADRRAVIALLADALERAQSDELADVVASTSKGLDEVLARGSAAPTSFKEANDQALAEFERAADESRRQRLPGIPWPLPELNRATGGMRPGELIGVAARTSLGKTAFANQVAVHAAKRGHKGGIITLEESPAGLAMRAIACNGAIPLTRLRHGDLGVDRPMRETMADLGGLPLWIDSKTFELRAICGRITQLVRRYGVEFAVVDHIGLVNVSAKSGQKRYELVGEVTRSLKQLAEHLRIPIIAVVQVGRDSDKESRPPRLSDLRESGNIEQDLNICVALHQHVVVQPGDDQPLKVGLLKNRYGQRGWCRQEFLFRGSIQRFEETTRDAA